MKKFLPVVALLILFTACKGKKEEKKPDEPTTTTPTTTEPTTTPTSSGVPSFSDPDVSAYVNAYEEYIANYKKVVESKDMTKMGDLAKTAQDLAAKATAATQKLANSPEDAKKLADYMTAKAAEVTELSKKLTGQ